MNAIDKIIFKANLPLLEKIYQLYPEVGQYLRQVNYEKDKSPLYLAVRTNNFELFKYLLHIGAPIHQTCEKLNGDTIISLVTSKPEWYLKFMIEFDRKLRNNEIMKQKDFEYIISPKPLLSYKNKNLHILMAYLQDTPNKTVEFYMELQKLDKQLDYNRMEEFIVVIKTISFSFFKLWIENYDFILNFQGRNGTTALCRATCYMKGQIIEHLLSMGADINIPDSDGNLPIHYAVKNSITEYFPQLVGNNINVQNREGFTPIMLFRDCDAFLDCMPYNPDFKIKNNRGETILHLICNHRDTVYPVVVKLLYETTDIFEILDLNDPTNYGEGYFQSISFYSNLYDTLMTLILLYKGAIPKIGDMYSYHTTKTITCFAKLSIEEKEELKKNIVFFWRRLH